MVKLWSLSGCRELAVLDVGEPVKALSWSPDGTSVVAGLATTSVISIAVDLGEMSMTKAKVFVQLLDAAPSSVALSTDGSTLLIDGSYYGAGDGAKLEGAKGSFKDPLSLPVEVDSEFSVVFQMA